MSPPLGSAISNLAVLPPLSANELLTIDQPTGADDYFFEGAEKRLVLYFADPSPADLCGPPDLRPIARSAWAPVLDQYVSCKILNDIDNGDIHAYLLSESSMFVSRNRIMIKTCGTTTLLNVLPRMVAMARERGFTAGHQVFFSRKNLLRPEAQYETHRSFGKEIAFLDQSLTSMGVPLEFGHRASDRFYLYTSNSLPSLGPHIEHYKFEIIMEQLDPKVMAHFIYGSAAGKISAREVTIASGISSLIPGMIIDDYAFDPCGYSMNGIRGPNYMTIHITPEDDFSFVSLETDAYQESYGRFIAKVVACFKPGKFMINLMAPKAGAAPAGRLDSADIATELVKSPLFGFERRELLVEPAEKLDIIFGRYERA